MRQEAKGVAFVDKLDGKDDCGPLHSFAVNGEAHTTIFEIQPNTVPS